jgi:hypothetical protein
VVASPLGIARPERLPVRPQAPLEGSFSIVDVAFTHASPAPIVQWRKGIPEAKISYAGHPNYLLAILMIRCYTFLSKFDIELGHRAPSLATHLENS